MLSTRTLIDRAHQELSNGGAVEIQVIFDRDDPFLAMQKVNFSSLHEEGRPDDALHQSHSIELVNAL
jgi:hypothetical protein